MTNPASNLVQIFLNRCDKDPAKTALLYKPRGGVRYFPVTWAEWRAKVEKTAWGLHAAGVLKGDRVAILSENRPEWAASDLAILSLGAITVPIYPTCSPQDIRYLIENAGVRVLFLSSLEHWNRLSSVMSLLSLKLVVIFDPLTQPVPQAISYAALLETGRQAAASDPCAFAQRVSAVQPHDLATLIYTSGTTGPPKGVMLTHHNFITNCIGASDRILLSESDTALSFLPLSHVFERMAGYYYMIYHGAAIAYAENMQTVPDNMREIQPTVCAAVPRFYEKVYAKIIEKAQASPFRKKIFDWAIASGKRVRIAGDKSFGAQVCFAIASLLVFNKLKRQLGGRLRFFISGGAPLSQELAEFFYCAGILIMEGYGLTETSPVIAVNSPVAFKFGTVGKPLLNVEVRIAPDGEILTRGPHIMTGYYNNPAATAEVLQNGWFHTGDIGLLDGDGYLKITDRKKDIIKTSGGKMISPQNIEGKVLGDPLFSQMVVIGDKRNYLVALIVPNFTEVRRYAEEKKITASSPQELLSQSEILKWIDCRFREKTADLAQFEQVKYYHLLDHELTQADGELTPTLKVKRKVIAEKYGAIIERLYQKGAQNLSTIQA